MAPLTAIFSTLCCGQFDATSAPETSKTCSGLTNSAFVFIKPHANTPATQALVKEELTKAGIDIKFESEIEGEQIDEKKLIDQHYYAIASKATILSPKDILVPADRFEEKFKEPWADVLSQNRAANAMEACKEFGVTAEELDSAWREAEKEDKIIKFGGGFYCGLMKVGEKSLYVFNAFFMSMRSKFVGKGTSIHCYEVEWNPAKLPWAKFRGEIVGTTDPSAAPEGAIRKLILNKYEELGLKAKPNKGDNGVHASASPLEGLGEKTNWLGMKVEKDAFGKALLDSGIPEQVIQEWSLDPRVKLPDGEIGSIFDYLEDKDVDECLEKMVQLHQLNK